MKYIVILVLILGFTASAYAVGLNGKGLFCPDANEGYWFKDGIAIKWFIQGSSLKTVSQNSLKRFFAVKNALKFC